MRTARFLTHNLLAVLLAVALFGLFGLVVRKERPRDFPVDLPADRVVGAQGEELSQGGVALRVEGVERVGADALPADVRLSARANRPDRDDYLVLTVTVANLGDEPRPFVWLGLDATATVRLGQRRPQPGTELPLPPDDVRTIARQEPLVNDELVPGESRTGRLAFAVRPVGREFSLLVVDDGGGPAPFAFEIALDETGS